MLVKGRGISKAHAYFGARCTEWHRCRAYCNSYSGEVKPITNNTKVLATQLGAFIYKTRLVLGYMTDSCNVWRGQASGLLFVYRLAYAQKHSLREILKLDPA